MFSQSNVVELKSCLACGSNHLVLTLDLKNQPLANSFKQSIFEQQDEYPLAINRCTSCYHLQLTHAVNPELIYKNYVYVSGTSKTYLDYMRWYAGWTAGIFNLLTNRKLESVIDIGCNDGSQLNFYDDCKIRTVGVDPAENLASISSKRHEVYCKFFDKSFAEQINDTFDIITMQNAFAHQSNPFEFLEAIKLLMHDNSLVFLSTSQSNMIINNEFDTIYHEHVNFYNINSMNKLAGRAGLYLVNVYKTPIHGISYVFILSKNKTHFNQSTLDFLINGEATLGLYNDNTYVKYYNRCEHLRNELIKITDNYRNETNCKVIGYGAAAKGITLLNYTNLNLDLIIDDNPLKQGTYAPGSNIPIVSINQLDSLKENVLFIPLAWNFYNEIVARIKEKRQSANDKFCRYFPSVEISS